MGYLPRLYDGLGNHCSVPCIQHQAREGFEEEPTVVALEEEARKQSFAGPGSACVEFFSHHLTAALTLPVRLVERFLDVCFGSQLIFETFDQLQVKLRVELFEHCHR